MGGLQAQSCSPGSAIQLSGMLRGASVLIIAGQLVQGAGELCGSVWCSALARSQDAGCRLKGCAETELIKPAGRELSLCRQISL